MSELNSVTSSGSKQHIIASAERIMSSGEYLREFVNERLTVAAEEIFRYLKKTIVEYEEEIERQRRLLDDVRTPAKTIDGTRAEYLLFQ